MRQVRSTDTSPERAIRSLLHCMGFRFRLYPHYLPGKPDMVLPRFRTVVFVHGCFWHRHPRCSRATTPATNQEYWLPKFERTVVRDQRIQAELRALGWNVIVVWECELKDIAMIKNRLIIEIPSRSQLIILQMRFCLLPQKSVPSTNLTRRKIRRRSNNCKLHSAALGQQKGVRWDSCVEQRLQNKETGIDRGVTTKGILFLFRF
jgi:DNA mismatch endonuclease (patch repair protein)